MRVKLEWLNELVEIADLSIDQLVKILSLHSIEVECIEKVVSGTNLVIGHVIKRIDHPDSDHLSVCNVDVKDEVLQIVCGAPNVQEGQFVIVAKNGAALPGGLKIKRTKIRGIESNGMICSLNELGIEKKYIPEEYQSGIFYFKEKVKIGDDAIFALNLEDFVIELGLTPNRGDLLSMLGVAIEVSAVLNRPLKKMIYEKVKTYINNSDELTVINDTKGCIGYFGQIFRNIEIKPSPWWLVSRLIAFGVRSINNVVDITNYILALFGQPLHAFDYEKLGNKILVRNAYENEKITTLDEIERTLITSDIVITNGSKPVALAGVMGGLDTEITKNTKSIVIEAAVFDPVSIRKTSQRLGLRSESSTRFEKNVDINRTKLALEYTAYLLKMLANAEPSNSLAFSGISEVDPVEIPISENDIKKYLGVEVTKQDLITVFERLGFSVNQNVIVKVPNRRNDIKIKNDLIEEFARVYGYDKLPLTLPSSSIAGELTEEQQIRRKIRNVLVGLGLKEIISYSLISEKENDYFKYNQVENSNSISLMMPLTQEHKDLRKSLSFGLIENAKYCFSRKIKDIAIFELGKVYYQENNKYQEEEILSILIANQFSSNLWSGHIEKADFYLIKGILETLFKKMNLNVTFGPLDKEIEELHPKRTATIYFNDQSIGFVGSIHPKFAQENDLDNIYLAELKLSNILKIEQDIIRYVPISKVPNMERDIAIVVDKSVLASEIINTIKNVDNKLLSEVKVFDVYTGEKIHQNQKSIALKLIFSSYETLTDDIINGKINKIIKELQNKYQATLRS